MAFNILSSKGIESSLKKRFYLFIYFIFWHTVSSMVLYCEWLGSVRKGTSGATRQHCNATPIQISAASLIWSALAVFFPFLLSSFLSFLTNRRLSARRCHVHFKQSFGEEGGRLTICREFCLELNRARARLTISLAKPAIRARHATAGAPEPKWPLHLRPSCAAAAVTQ